MPDRGGRVVVATRGEGEVLLSVADNGPGGAGASRGVFEKFRQVGVTLTNKPKGTGLGLTISRSIIEHFGGRIWASGAGGGAPYSASASP